MIDKPTSSNIFLIFIFIRGGDVCGSMLNVVGHMDVVRSPKRTLAEPSGGILKSRPKAAFVIFVLVEMRRIELLSEDNVTWISPSAVCVFI